MTGGLTVLSGYGSESDESDDQRKGNKSETQTDHRIGRNNDKNGTKSRDSFEDCKQKRDETKSMQNYIF